MKQELRELLNSTFLVAVGFYARVQFGRIKFNVKQLVALCLFGLGIVAIINELDIPEIYKLTIAIVSGVWLPNLVQALIKAGNKSEESAANKISKKIDNIL